MTREEQIKQAADEYMQTFKSGPRGSFINGAEWADQHPHWIPVEEKLPKENGRYWCCDDDGGQEELKWYNGSWYGLLDPYPIEGITHWMPMPEAPRKEE